MSGVSPDKQHSRFCTVQECKLFSGLGKSRLKKEKICVQTMGGKGKIIQEIGQKHNRGRDINFFLPLKMPVCIENMFWSLKTMFRGAIFFFRRTNVDIKKDRKAENNAQS